MRQVGLALLFTGVVAVGLHWGTFVAGGSDSYCYSHQAERWASLVPGATIGVAMVYTCRTLSPGRPGRTLRSALRPWATSRRHGQRCDRPSVSSRVVDSHGAVSRRWRPDAIFLVVPLFGALLVGATYVAGARYGARVGMAAAVLAACSPAFLYQLVQPMSDVPAAALWMSAVAAATGTQPRGPLLAGIAAGAAILMRPNLLCSRPAWTLSPVPSERSWHPRSTRPSFTWRGGGGCAVVALIPQHVLRIALHLRLRSLEALFGIEHAGQNARGISPGCPKPTPLCG